MTELEDARMKGWITIIQACNSSGQGKKEWCEENGVDVRKFYYWQRKIREELYQEMQEDDLAMALSACVQPTPEFAEVTLPPAPPKGSECEREPAAVLKVGAVTIEIYNTASKSLLENMWRMMRYAV